MHVYVQTYSMLTDSATSFNLNCTNSTKRVLIQRFPNGKVFQTENPDHYYFPEESSAFPAHGLYGSSPSQKVDQWVIIFWIDHE